MSYTGAGVGQGVAGFGELFAKLFGQMQGRRDQQSELAQREALERDELARREKSDRDLATYREGSLESQRTGQEQAQARWESDRAAQSQRETIQTRQRERDRADRAREGGFEYTPAQAGAIMPTGPFGGAFAMMLPREGQVGAYNPDLDPRVVATRDRDERQHRYRMEEIGATAAGRGSGTPARDPNQGFREDVLGNLMDEAAAIRERASDANMGGEEIINVQAELDALAKQSGFQSWADVQSLTRQGIGLQDPQRQNLQYGPPMYPGEGTIAPQGAAVRPEQDVGNPPQGPNRVDPAILTQVASMGIPDGVPPEDWNMVLYGLSQGMSPMELARQMPGGMPASVRESILSALGIGRD